MNAASQVPSGVLISTSVSTISMPMSAAATDVTDAAMPALIKRAVKSRRVRSPGCDWLLGWVFSSSVIVFSCKFFVLKSLSHFAGRPHGVLLYIHIRLHKGHCGICLGRRKKPDQQAKARRQLRNGQLDLCRSSSPDTARPGSGR